MHLKYKGLNLRLKKLLHFLTMCWTKLRGIDADASLRGHGCVSGPGLRDLGLGSTKTAQFKW